MICQNLLLMVMFSLLVACNHTPSISDHWQSDKGANMLISQQEDRYFVQVKGRNYTGLYDNSKNVVDINSPLGSIVYSKEKDKLYYAGEEFARKSHIEAEERMIYANKLSFKGAWKKDITDGNSGAISDIVIGLMASGMFDIIERKNPLVVDSYFHNIKYKDGAISGLYHYAVDIEHDTKFKITKLDNNTIIYTTEFIKQPFKRYIEMDEFTGIWSGQRMVFIITKEIKGYRLIITNNSVQGSPTDTLLCKFRHGRILYPGRSKDYYKYEIPTIGTLPNGHLLYSDGTGSFELSKE